MGSASWQIFLRLLEGVLEELPLAMLLDQQLEELLEGSSTSHLQARLLEVLLARWSVELPVPVPVMLLPTGSAASSAEVERADREAKAGRLLDLVSLGKARVERVERVEREAKVERLLASWEGRAFLEGKAR